MELARGVHAIEVTADLGDRTLTIHPALAETDRGIILIDVGLESTVDTYRDALHETGHDLSDVTGIIITHQDGDHAGALAEIADATEATVYAHRRATPFINGTRDLAKGDNRYPAVPVDVQLVDGVRFRTWGGQMEVIFTPGHAPGHISLYFPDSELLVAADAVTAADGVLQGPNEQFTLDWGTAIESVHDLAARDITTTHCYHGGPVEQGTARLQAIATDS